MATLVAIAYRDQHTAEQARATVWRLEDELIIQAQDVAVISRDPDGKYHVHTSHSGLLTPAERSGVGSGVCYSARCS
jgi:uncharacterized membrane protein